MGYEVQSKRPGSGQTWRSDAIGLNEPRGYDECEIDIAILRQLPQEDGWQGAEYRIVEVVA